MKKILYLTGIILFLTACTSNVIDNSSEELVPVTVRVENFSISQEEFQTTRATQSAVDYTNVKAITLAFYSSNGTEAYKVTQLRDDASTYTTFGEFSCNLPIGAYTMVVVGRAMSSGDVFVLTSPTEAAYTTERARETFAATQNVTVTVNEAVNLNVSLNRVCAKLEVLSTDNRPASVTKYRTTYTAGGKGFNPTTGLATSNTGFSVTNNANTAVGEPGNYYSFLFLASDEQTVNVTIEVLDASDNVLFTKTVANVPFKRNRVTKLRGAMFTSAATAAAFQVETSWLDEEVVDF